MRTTTKPRAKALAASLFGLSAAMAIMGVVVSAVTPGVPPDEVVFTAGQGLLSVAFPAVGALIAARHPRNAVGWILIGVGLLQAISATGYAYAMLAPAPSAYLLLWLSNWVWFPSLALIVTFLLLLFPDGRLPTRRWRPFALVAGLVVVSGTIGAAVHAFPLLVTGDPTAGESVMPLVFMFGGLFAAGLGSIASLVVRFRRSSGVSRQQLKWLALGGIGTFAGVLLTFAPADNVVFMLPVVVLMLALPVTIGMAILRYRLFDIDRLISRTLSYLLLTGLLAAVYTAGVVLLHPLVARVTGESQLAIAISTIAVAALFRPARRRIQAAVDRRFNRARYDAQRVVDEFSAELRNQVDLDRLNDQLLAVVGATMAPARAALWLRAGVRQAPLATNVRTS